MVFDPVTRNLFLHGGEGVLTGSPVYLTDVMQYNIDSNLTTWMAGSSASNPAASQPPVKGMAGGKVTGFGKGTSDPWLRMDPSGSLWYGMGRVLSQNSCNNMFYLASPASILTIELTSSLGSIVSSPLSATIRSGTNNITLGWIVGGVMDLNFSIWAEDGISSTTPVCIRILQIPPNTNTSWAAFVAGPGISLSLTDTSPALDGVLYLPSTTAYGVVTIDFTLFGFGAMLRPPTQPATFSIGSRATWTYYSWTVQAESGLFSPTFVLSIYVAPSTLANWTVTAMSSGSQSSSLDLTSATAEPVNTLSFPFQHDGISMSSLTYWMSGHNCGTVPSSNGSPGLVLVPSDEAVPAARREAAYWTGVDGHLYHFGTKCSIAHHA